MSLVRAPDLGRRHSFILTLWMEAAPEAPDAPVWHISLEDVHASHRMAFHSLEALMRFLDDWMHTPAGGNASAESADER